MGKIAFIFPGQGSQYVGMGLDFYNNSEVAKNLFNQFDNQMEKTLSKLCFEGPEDELKQTINTQPAILATSIVAYELLKQKADIKPDFVAGHSLGEYAALYTANVLDLNDTIFIVQKRAELMNKVKNGSMTAILGLDEAKINELIENSSEYGVISIANYNTPEQIVITGDTEAVNNANKLATEFGAKRVVPLAVSGAFHSPLLQPIAEEFSKYVSEININDADIPVITNIDAKPTTNKNEFSSKMPEQIYSSVYWTQTINYMLSQGVDTFIEIGPGKVLSGMIKKISRQSKTFNISDIQSLENTINSLNNEVLV